MLGTLITRSMVRKAFACLNQRDIEAFLFYWADDAVYHYPGKLSVSGRIEGKEAIRTWFSRLLALYPELVFRVISMYVKDIFSLTPSNSVAVESRIEGVRRDGFKYVNTYVTLIHIKGGKVVLAQDFPFDFDAAKEGWGE